MIIEQSVINPLIWAKLPESVLPAGSLRCQLTGRFDLVNADGRTGQQSFLRLLVKIIQRQQRNFTSFASFQQSRGKSAL